MRFRALGVIGPLLLAVVLAGYFYWQWQSAERSRKQLPDLVGKIAELVVLPEGEEPQLLEIDDKSKLDESLSFFSSAENGDQLLIYQQAKRAYLYRPKLNKLVNIAPISVTEDEKEVKYKFAVRNGAGVSGIAAKYAETVKAVVKGAEVIEVDNAENLDNEKSRLVSFIDDGKEADRVAKLLQMELGDLPDDEVKPKADFLVIVGKDKSE